MLRIQITYPDLQVRWLEYTCKIIYGVRSCVAVVVACLRSAFCVAVLVFFATLTKEMFELGEFDHPFKISDTLSL